MAEVWDDPEEDKRGELFAASPYAKSIATFPTSKLLSSLIPHAAQPRKFGTLDGVHVQAGWKVPARCHAEVSSSSTGGTAPPVAPAPIDELSSDKIQQLEVYLDFLLETNKVMNLTAVTDRSEAWERHIIDSLALMPVLDLHVAKTLRPATTKSRGDTKKGPSKKQKQTKKSRNTAEFGIGEVYSPDSSEESDSASSADGSAGSTVGSTSESVTPFRVIDVGTGGGLPGMVIAAARPEWKVTLLDSLRKRCDFLKKAVELAGLKNVDVVWCRAEEGGQRPELRHSYDIAVARAVADSAVLAELCLPFVRVGGLWVAAKGPNPDAEVAGAEKAIRQLGGQLVALERVGSFSEDGQRTALVVLKGSRAPQQDAYQVGDGQRTALVVLKVSPTAAQYPRAPGTPSRKPIK
eukprot:gene11260-18886_t